VRILIADDNSIVRADLRVILEDAGHELCAEARDGLEAVELARETRPDLAVLDVRMARLNGIEAARRIRRDREIPIVVVTGYAGSAHVDLAAAGVSGSSLAKPFHERDVLLAIEEAVRQGKPLRRRTTAQALASRLRALLALRS
jgi:response regulator NasT